MDFILKLNEIELSTTSAQKRLIHYKSLRNFINFYDSNKKEKAKITNLIAEYIELLESKNYDITKEESKNVYKSFVYTLGIQYYRKHLGFVSFLSIDLVVFFFFIPLGLVWFLFGLSTILYFTFVIWIIYWTNYLIKIITHKVYGYRY